MRRGNSALGHGGDPTRLRVDMNGAGSRWGVLDERTEAWCREKYERWVRTLVERLPEPFDEPLWSALTAGRARGATP